MRDALVFNGDLPLGFCEFRRNLARLPEVLVRLNEAQRVCDDLLDGPVNLVNCLGEDQHGFASVDRRIQKMLSVVLNVALLDRYLSRHETPKFLVIASPEDLALQVFTGQSQFIRALCHCFELPGLEPLAKSPTVEFEIHLLSREDELSDWIEQQKIKRLIMVGPGPAFWTAARRSRIRRETEITEMIRLDPKLKWFWAEISGAELESAI